MTTMNENPIFGNSELDRILGTVPDADRYASQLQRAELAFDDDDSLASLFTGQSTFGPQDPQQRVSFARKIRAAAALENVSGRIAQTIDRAISNPIQSDPQFRGPDGKLTTDFDVDSWVAQNQSDLERSEVGKVILRNYSLGRYDEMDGRRFFAAVGYDYVDDSLRQDLSASTGALAGDFAATVVGASLDPAALFGGGAVLRGASVARNLRTTRNLAQAWERTKTYRRLVQTSQLGKTGFVVEQGKQALSIGLFSEPALQLLDQNRELEDFAANVVENVAADLLLSSAFAIFSRKPLPGESVSDRYKAFLNVKQQVAKAVREGMESADTIAHQIVDDAAEALGSPEAQRLHEEIAEVNRRKATSFSESLEADPDLDSPASLVADDSSPVAPETTLAADSPTARPVPAEGAREGPTESAVPPDAPDALFADGGRSALTPKDRELLERLIKLQNEVRETPLDVEDFARQLDQIASRGVQLFNFGRLDSIGLRKVRIEQPVQVIADRVINQGLDLTLENILAELKKATPEEVADVLRADKGTAPTYNALVDLLGDERAASQAMLQAADALIEQGRSGFGNKGRVPQGETRKLKPTSTVSANQPIESELDYFPDRANDLYINKVLPRLRAIFDKVEEWPLIGRAAALRPEGKRVEVATPFAIHHNWTFRKHLLSENPIIAGVANTLLEPMHAMRGQTANTIKAKFSVEQLQRIAHQRMGLLIQASNERFIRFVKDAGLGQSVGFSPAAATRQDYLLSQEYRRYRDGFNEAIERVRVLSNDYYTNSGDRVRRFELEKLRDDVLYGYLPADLRNAIEAAGTRSQAIESFKKTIHELDQLGAIRNSDAAKLTLWMTPEQRDVFNQTTSIRLDAEAFTLEELDQVMRTLFLTDPIERISLFDRTPTGEPTYKGLEAFIARQELDVDSGRKIEKHGIITRDELESAIKDNDKAKHVVRAIVHEFNTRWGGLIPINKVDRIRDYATILMRKPHAVNFDFARSVSEIRDLFKKLHLVEQLTDRIRELEKFRLRRILTPEDFAKVVSGDKEADTPFSPLIRSYENIRMNLRNATRPARYSVTSTNRLTRDIDTTLPIGSPASYHYLSQLADKQFSAIAEEAREYKRIAGIPAKDYDKWDRLVGQFAANMREQFGLTESPAPSALGQSLIRLTQSMMLGKAGLNVIVDASKAIAHGLVYGKNGGLKGSIESFMALGVSARKSGLSDANLGYVVESMQTHLDDVTAYVARRHEDVMGGSYTDIGPRSPLEKGTHLQRWLIGKASATELFADISKMGSYRIADAELSGPDGLVHLSRRIVDLIRDESLAPLAAAQRVATESGTPMNRLYHAFTKIAANMSHDDIRLLSDLFEKARKKEIPLKARFGPKTVNIETWELPEGAGEVERNVLRNYGRLLDYWIEKELLNIPTGSSTLTISNPGGFLNRAMTLFLRPAISQIDNMTLSQANLGAIPRASIASIVIASAFGVQYLKALATGDSGVERYRQKWDSGPKGQVELFAEALDYSGYMGLVASRSLNAGLDLVSPSFYDRSNAGEFAVMSPLQSTILLAIRAISGLGDWASGKEYQGLSFGQRKSISKFVTLNLADSIWGSMLREGMEMLDIENTEMEGLYDFLYPSKE